MRAILAGVLSLMAACGPAPQSAPAWDSRPYSAALESRNAQAEASANPEAFRLTADSARTLADATTCRTTNAEDARFTLGLIRNRAVRRDLPNDQIDAAISAGQRLASTGSPACRAMPREMLTMLETLRPYLPGAPRQAGRVELTPAGRKLAVDVLLLADAYVCGGISKAEFVSTTSRIRSALAARGMPQEENAEAWRLAVSALSNNPQRDCNRVLRAMPAIRREYNLADPKPPTPAARPPAAQPAPPKPIPFNPRDFEDI